MKFERLRLVGFKTFVDPTDIVIEPGLTGIVGPNGCGKSNLVEALRWVMGETSSKSLRGTGMEDVIFGGSGTRPERNMAEVSIRIGEPPADLGGHLAGAETLDVSRKIERDSGSTYRINGREVRARDVQMLFADAASGARSPSLVRQGQIGEIISAKPQHRRRILEDAAGIAGLHARRHEAEIRLRHAEENLNRAEDVLGQLERQIGDLKRQARQAERYKGVAAEIRILEIAQLAAGYHRAKSEAEAAETARDRAIRDAAACLVVQGETERARAVAAHEIEALREAAIRAGAALQRLIITRESLDADLKRAEDKISEIAARRIELARDQARAKQVVADAEAATARLNAEKTTHQDAIHAAQSALESAKADAQTADIALQTSEAALQSAQTQQANRLAQARALDQRQSEAKVRHARLLQGLQAAKAERERLNAASAGLQKLDAMQVELDAMHIALKSAEQAGFEREQEAQKARQIEQASRPKLAESERNLQRFETEARTIRKMVDTIEPGLWRRAIDETSIEKGYENALGAALGDDLEAALEQSAPRHWSLFDLLDEDPALPAGAEPLARFAKAPPALARRLRQIGVVARKDGEALRIHLKPGQRLVSVEGDLWRWDGFTRKAEAPSAAAKRLVERNRLDDIEQQAKEARIARDAARAATEAAMKAQRAADEIAGAARDEARQLRLKREALQQNLQRDMRQLDEQRSKLMAAEQRISALEADEAEARALLDTMTVELSAQPHDPALDEALPARRDEVQAARTALAEARGRETRLVALIDLGTQRLAAIADEENAWITRTQQALSHAGEGDARFAKLEADAAAAEGAPAEIAAQRRTIVAQIETAQSLHREAEDKKAEGETHLRLADDAAREAINALSLAREARARAEAMAENARERIAHFQQALEETAGKSINEVAPILADYPAISAMNPDQIETRLADLKADRDKLGAVNLRADIELNEIEASRSALSSEREEITEAIRRFRQAITTLNAEGRTRLRAAFDVVNGHFTRLFETLFGGGSAELQLVEADDPLDAGLELLAKPPGKKPQHLSLLSGGEQALTAIALIFAVFLTNPSPICVLDEVDAPLDDSNVERLCDLLTQMARETETRFLVITHNPISMARMDRLFGVTMVERGVSQLVSVDLAEAERFVQAI